MLQKYSQHRSTLFQPGRGNQPATLELLLCHSAAACLPGLHHSITAALTPSVWFSLTFRHCRTPVQLFLCTYFDSKELQMRKKGNISGRDSLFDILTKPQMIVVQPLCVFLSHQMAHERCDCESSMGGNGVWWQWFCYQWMWLDFMV